tara:strand:+ start:289 stop:423 length:135 start_codon:yes stop_codon:yes gene_type:complete
MAIDIEINIKQKNKYLNLLLDDLLVTDLYEVRKIKADLDTFTIN